jgi:hypothetical protein
LDLHNEANEFPDAVSSVRAVYEERKTKEKLLSEANPQCGLLVEARNRTAEAALDLLRSINPREASIHVRSPSHNVRSF